MRGVLGCYCPPSVVLDFDFWVRIRSETSNGESPANHLNRKRFPLRYRCFTWSRGVVVPASTHSLRSSRPSCSCDGRYRWDGRAFINEVDTRRANLRHRERWTSGLCISRSALIRSSEKGAGNFRGVFHVKRTSDPWRTPWVISLERWSLSLFHVKHEIRQRRRSNLQEGGGAKVARLAVWFSPRRGLSAIRDESTQHTPISNVSRETGVGRLRSRHDRRRASNLDTPSMPRSFPTFHVKQSPISSFSTHVPRETWCGYK